jgi:hypothetical protein
MTPESGKNLSTNMLLGIMYVHIFIWSEEMKEKKRARDNFRIIDIKVCAEIENEI